MASEESQDVETYFSKVEHLFPHLENGNIPTEQFLSACKGIADFVGFLGTAFSPVKSDIQGNVDKVRNYFEKNRESKTYLQQLIDNDLAENGGKLGIATEGLLWLKRGLEFMLQLLTLMVTEYKMFEDKSRTENLSNAINKAYITTLKRHHGFVSKNLFKIVIHAAPYRKTILKAVALGRENLDDICIGHIESHLDNFRLNVDALVNYYLDKNLNLCSTRINQYSPMVWRIVRQFLNNEKVIQEMSESAPMKAAAKAIVRGAASAQQKYRTLELEKKMGKYTKIYKEEYQKALKDK